MTRYQLFARETGTYNGWHGEPVLDLEAAVYYCKMLNLRDHDPAIVEHPINWTIQKVEVTHAEVIDILDSYSNGLQPDRLRSCAGRS